MFKSSTIYWSLKSETDPRWNTNGQFQGFATAGMSVQCSAWIETQTSILGEPPNDLSYMCMKE